MSGVKCRSGAVGDGVSSATRDEAGGEEGRVVGDILVQIGKDPNGLCRVPLAAHGKEAILALCGVHLPWHTKKNYFPIFKKKTNKYL